MKKESKDSWSLNQARIKVEDHKVFLESSLVMNKLKMKPHQGIEKEWKRWSKRMSESMKEKRYVTKLNNSRNKHGFSGKRKEPRACEDMVWGSLANPVWRL